MNKKFKDYYAILEVSKDATQDEIKKSYRKKALEYHPDRNKEKGAEEKFKEIAEAYKVLSDPNKKSQYDQFGTIDISDTGDPREVFVNFSRFFDEDDNDLENIISRMTGRGFSGFARGNRNSQKIRQKIINPDIRIACNITLKDVIKGAEVILEFSRAIACDVCQTTGIDSSKESEICEKCNGKGMLIGRMSNNMIIQQVCEICRGNGKKLHSCSKCSGNGYSNIEEKISVKIPKEIHPMSILRIKNKGNITYKGNYKIEGSLFVVIDYVAEEDGVTLKNGEIFATVKIPFNLMLAGDKIKINFFNSKKIMLELNPDNPSGYQYEVKDGGIVNGKSAFIKVFAGFPQNKISEENRKNLIKILRDIYGESPTTFKPESL